MTLTSQINKLRSAARITAGRWDGLQMPVALQDAVRIAFRTVDRVDRGEPITATEAQAAFNEICKAS